MKRKASSTLDIRIVSPYSPLTHREVHFSHFSENVEDVGSITEIISVTPDLSIFTNATLATYLDQTLSNYDNNYTVFAPNDDAFQRLSTVFNISEHAVRGNRPPHHYCQK
jgi:uncharacterized surface protein with fasciclin (FAS1) repeats